MTSTSRRKLTVILSTSACLALFIGWFGIGAPSAMEDHDTLASAEFPILAAARGTVDVEGGLLRIGAPREGLLVAVSAREGDRAKAGDILAVLDARQEQQAAEMARQDVVQAEQRQKLLALKLKAQSRDVDRIRRAAAGKAVSEQALDEALAAKGGLAIELDIGASVLAAARSRLEMAEREVELRTLRAPADGLVVRRRAKAGEMVSPQNSPDLFTLLPDGRKIVTAEIPEQFLNAIEPGLPVEIVEEERMARSFAGKIERISPVLLQSTAQSGNERNDIRTATSIVSFEQDTPFRVGQRVIVRVRK